MHFFDPHGPYQLPPAYRPTLDDLEGRPFERIRRLYHAEMRYMDAEIGRALDEFDAHGFFEDLIIVVMSDHGEPLGEQHVIPGGHSPLLKEVTLHVPLLLRVPGRVTPGVEDRQVSGIDVFPTLLELVSLPVPEGRLGHRLLDLPDEPRPVYSETLYQDFPDLARPGEELASVRLEGWRYVLSPEREELYDLRSDPGEANNVLAVNPDRAARLKASLDEFRSSWKFVPPLREIELDGQDQEDHRERLRSLGYIE